MNKNTDIARSTTDLWPENPESRRWMMAGGENPLESGKGMLDGAENGIAFAQPLIMVGEVDNSQKIFV